MLALSLLDLVSRKDGLLALPINIRIDRSINRKLYCFVTKMAKLISLVDQLDLVSNKRWAPKLTCQR
jgi:hypothetical protein